MFLGKFHQQIIAFHKVGTYNLPVVIPVYIDSAKQSIRFFPDTSPSLIMFPYLRLESLVGPTPSTSPISTLYMD